MLETLEEGASDSEVASRHGVDVSQVFNNGSDAGLRSRPSASSRDVCPFADRAEGYAQQEQKEAPPLPSGLIELELAGAPAHPGDGWPRGHPGCD